MDKLRAFFADESGQTAIEYGLIAAVGALAIIGSLQFFGESVSSTFEQVSTAFGSATP